MRRRHACTREYAASCQSGLERVVIREGRDREALLYQVYVFCDARREP